MAIDFPTTSWSLIRQAGGVDSPESREALASLCRRYWEPLYVYLRRTGRTNEDAEDLVQGFFARLLESDRFEQVSPGRGSFRGFLLVCLKNYVISDHAQRQARKRGGDHVHVPFELDVAHGDRRYRQEAAAEQTPEESYERRWALSVLENVSSRLRAERVEAGEGPSFDALSGFLPGGLQPESYESVAARLGMTAGAVRVAVHRLRGRYREMLRQEMEVLVGDPAEVDAEIRYLRKALTQ